MRSLSPADAIGTALWLLVCIAVLVSAGVTGAGTAWPALGTLLLAATAYVSGRVLAPALFPVAASVVTLVLLVVLIAPASLAGGPLAPPLGYGNANAALYVQAAGLAAMAAVTAPGGARRGVALVATVVVVLVTAATRSLAGLLTAAVVLAVLVAILLRWRPRRRSVLSGCLVIVLAAHVAVLVLGITYRPADPQSSRAETAVAVSLSERRLSLWRDAVTIASDHAVVGVGPREFPSNSPTAQMDADTREAHSATLQMAAEIGWLGAAALLGVLVWAAARPVLTGNSARATGAAVLASTSATALAVHSAVDYVLQFPLVVAAVALVIGLGTGAHGSRDAS